MIPLLGLLDYDRGQLILAALVALLVAGVTVALAAAVALVRGRRRWRRVSRSGAGPPAPASPLAGPGADPRPPGSP